VLQRNIKEKEMVMRWLVIMLTVVVAWSSNAAKAADALPLRARPSAYCQQNFDPVRVPVAKSDNRYALLLMFDASAKDSVHGFFHSIAADPVHSKPSQDGCVKDPDQAKENSSAAKPSGIIVQGSCPTDCVPPPRALKAAAATGNPEDPLGNDKWGIFSADDGSDTQILVWQILASDATHASRILTALKQEASFPRAAYRGNLLIGYRAPRPAATPKTP
jgi:hypothetical protein